VIFGPFAADLNEESDQMSRNTRNRARGRYAPAVSRDRADIGGNFKQSTKASCIAFAAVCSLAPISAFAQGLETNEDVIAGAQQFEEKRYGDFRDKLHDWKVTVGAGAIYLPEYEGSDKLEVRPFPLFSAQFGDNFFIDTRGVRYNFLQYGGLHFGLTGGYELGRKEDDSVYLRGMGDIDAGGLVGGIVTYEVGPFQLYGRLDKAIGGSEGLTGTVGAMASYQYERFIFSADVSGTWADNNYMEAYFGVNSIQSVNSGLPQYEAKAGIKRIDLKASVTYLLTENWLLTGTAGAGFLMGDAKDSPIVKDDVQPFAMLGVAYRF
jgi:outer membrane scaffolding protein for murein synthesis (MipA/OmpV family)